MTSQAIEKVVIVGGGSAGWMTAAALSHFLNLDKTRLTLIESDDIGTVGVGEATLPHLRFFNQKLGIDEREFMRETQSTFKLGIEFVNWGSGNDRYMHAFGEYGSAQQDMPFHHSWLKAYQNNEAEALSEYSLAVNAAKANKFQFPSADPNSVLSKYSYAYHVDATLYARFLRRRSEQAGTTRIEGKIAKVSQNKHSGFIETVTLQDGSVISGDLFIDCSGFKGLLIEQTLKSGFEDWSHWLPCNSAQAVPCERVEPLIPYSRATAQEAGWQWRIPLQHRTGNGYVYSSDFVDDERATETLISTLDAPATRDPIQLRFTTGRRKQFWNKNCVAIGLSCGFLEPLESTSIFLIQEAITQLIELFPDKQFDSTLSDEFNRLMNVEFEHIRDFLIAHYHVTERTDTEFWNYVRTMPIPDSLSHKLAMYKRQGHIIKYASGEFLDPSWLAVLSGQGMTPDFYHPSAARASKQTLEQILQKQTQAVKEGTSRMQNNAETLEAYLRQNSDVQNASSASASLYGEQR
ncbi:tryptophan halogenase family protein [Glaciecola siphonariae]|uniref:Tryptophan halogenase family protein n=1 Tax=Glaciecola siphonariae TaxID=521012 RepID=A0ABV9LWC9_9ALTE